MAFNFDIKECPNCGEWYAEHQGECPNPKCKRIADSFRQNEAVIVKKPRKAQGLIIAKFTKLEQSFIDAWALTDLPMPTPEYKFHPTRRWRFDFCFIDKKLAIECEGGTWSGGRHTTGTGYAGDCEKYNAATELGYRILRYTKIDGEAIAQIIRVYEAL